MRSSAGRALRKDVQRCTLQRRSVSPRRNLGVWIFPSPYPDFVYGWKCDFWDQLSGADAVGQTPEGPLLRVRLSVSCSFSSTLVGPVLCPRSGRARPEVPKPLTPPLAASFQSTQIISLLSRLIMFLARHYTFPFFITSFRENSLADFFGHGPVRCVVLLLLLVR